MPSTVLPADAAAPTWSTAARHRLPGRCRQGASGRYRATECGIKTQCHAAGIQKRWRPQPIIKNTHNYRFFYGMNPIAIENKPLAKKRTQSNPTNSAVFTRPGTGRVSGHGFSRATYARKKGLGSNPWRNKCISAAVRPKAQRLKPSFMGHAHAAQLKPCPDTKYLQAPRKGPSAGVAVCQRQPLLGLKPGAHRAPLQNPGPDTRHIEANRGFSCTKTNPRLLIINQITKNEPNFNVRS